MKKIFVMLLAFVLAFGLFGCADNNKNEDKGDTIDTKQDATIGLVVSTLNNPFFVDLRDGAQAEADKMGAKLIVLDSQDDAATEMSNVEDLITKKVDLILINPTDSDAVGNAVIAANNAKIPVITLDREAATGEVVSHIASDNVAGGKMAGEYIVKKLNGKGNVVELEGISGASAARERGKGFNDAIKGSDLKVVAKQTANFDRAEGLSVMENILQAQPQIDAVFAQNDEMALGALGAIKAAKRNILVVGFDATDDAIAAVKAGDLAATVQQLPKEIGSKGVDTALKVIEGGKVDQQVPIELQLVTNE